MSCFLILVLSFLQLTYPSYYCIGIQPVVQSMCNTENLVSTSFFMKEKDKLVQKCGHIVNFTT